MKRLNRVNYIIYFTIYSIISFLFLLILFWNWEDLFWRFIVQILLFWNTEPNDIIISLYLLLISIFWFVILIKRWHDYWKDAISVIALNIIPIYFIYLALKKGDEWDNKYWKIDNKVLFWEKYNKKRKNIFETIFYDTILWPVISEKVKDDIVWSKKGRIWVIAYTLLYITLWVWALFICLSLWYDNDDEILIIITCILLSIIPYKFILPLYISISDYIKWK